jgi:hypothetical protein
VARVDYRNILAATRTLLLADVAVAARSPMVLLDQSVGFSLDQPIINLTLVRRNAPADLQSLSASTRTRLDVIVAVWVYAFNMDQLVAEELRDDMIGEVELALMSDTTLGDSVGTSWIIGGDFESAEPHEGGMQGFVRAASIELNCRVTAVRS